VRPTYWTNRVLGICSPCLTAEGRCRCPRHRRRTAATGVHPGVLDEADLPTLRKMQRQLTHQAETRPFPAWFVARVLAAYFRRLAEQAEAQS
jgi:hypothetical protein